MIVVSGILFADAGQGSWHFTAGLTVAGYAAACAVAGFAGSKFSLRPDFGEWVPFVFVVFGGFVAFLTFLTTGPLGPFNPLSVPIFYIGASLTGLLGCAACFVRNMPLPDCKRRLPTHGIHLVYSAGGRPLNTPPAQRANYK